MMEQISFLIIKKKKNTLHKMLIIIDCLFAPSRKYLTFIVPFKTVKTKQCVQTQAVAEELGDFCQASPEMRESTRERNPAQEL